MALVKKQKLGKFLQRARAAAGFSQMDLANKLSYSSPQFVSNWERGLCSPPVDKLQQMAQILKINPVNLLNVILEDTELFFRSELKIALPKKYAKGKRNDAL